VINRSLPLISIQSKETQDHISVHVRDNGVGIDENEMEFIFRPFYTKSVDGLPSGSGFGLTITKKIVDLHGGHIDVTSAPDKGTTFILSFPKEIIKSV
jgi:signal transduction histidine kinase